MKIISVRQLALPEIKVIRYARFCDHRGYFTEHLRRSDLQTNPLTSFLRGIEFPQTNESFSKAGTVRGLHFQWNPYMGKLVRTLQGHLIDLILDIRKRSPTFGKIIAYDMPTDRTSDFNEWIWVPPGYAHGTFLREDTSIEYYCSGEYSPGCEAGISPFAKDIDWSLCDPTLTNLFMTIAPGTLLITEKDKMGFTLESWVNDQRSDHFQFTSAG
jgi:dTDP-4-dehydrorhamnose 3,5-epimerase